LAGLQQPSDSPDKGLPAGAATSDSPDYPNKSASDPDWLADQDDRRAAGHEIPLQDQRPRHLRPDPHRLAQPRVLIRKHVLLDPPKRRFEVRHHLLAP